MALNLNSMLKYASIAFRHKQNLSVTKRFVSRKGTTFNLRMFTKDNCQLCDESLETLANEVPTDIMNKISVEKVDITEDGNEDLYDRWKYEIPVFFLGEKYLCKNRIDIKLLLSKIKSVQ